MVSCTEAVSRRNIFVGGTCATLSALLVAPPRTIEECNYLLTLCFFLIAWYSRLEAEPLLIELITNTQSNNSTEMTFKGHSRSSEMSRFDTAHTISYYRSIVTMTLSISGKLWNLYIPHVFNAPVGDDPVGILQRCSLVGKPEWWGYHAEGSTGWAKNTARPPYSSVYSAAVFVYIDK